MTDTVTLILPDDVPQAVVNELQGDLNLMSEVDEVGAMTERAIDIAALMIWIAFTSDALAVASTAAKLFKKIAGHARAKGIKGAVIELPNGVRISMDSVTVEEIQQLVSDWKAEE